MKFFEGKGTPSLTSEVPLLSREYSSRKPRVHQGRALADCALLAPHVDSYAVTEHVCLRDQNNNLFLCKYYYDNIIIILNRPSLTIDVASLGMAPICV